RIRRAGEHEYLNVRAVAGSSLRWNDERKAELGDRYVCPDDVDIGFKVFEIGSTTIRWNTMNDEAFKEISDADYSKGDRDNLDFMPNSSDLDIVYEIMLRQYGIPLSTPIEKMSEISERTYCFADAVVVCLEAEMNDTLIERLANIEPTPAKFVLRDSAFGDDIELKDVSFRKLSALIRNHQTEEERKSKYNNYTVEFI
ncbi:MAG: site-specific DNA-methyltransferase, partial [Oscillospiraceae bacterium]|nr:site-specific DNA-methyltransferase [Oscillospiraceae bacterium]